MILRHRVETHPPKGRSGGRDRCERTARCPAISTPSKRINCVIVCPGSPAEVSLNEPELSGSRHCLCAGVRVELAVEVVDVGLILLAIARCWPSQENLKFSNDDGSKYQLFLSQRST